MYKDSKHTCRTIVVLVKRFLGNRSCCRRGLLKIPIEIECSLGLASYMGWFSFSLWGLFYPLGLIKFDEVTTLECGFYSSIE